jgi:hypothetical protein
VLETAGQAASGVVRSPLVVGRSEFGVRGSKFGVRSFGFEVSGSKFGVLYSDFWSLPFLVPSKMQNDVGLGNTADQTLRT